MRQMYPKTLVDIGRKYGDPLARRRQTVRVIATDIFMTTRV
jgi:hypothetical protein